MENQPMGQPDPNQASQQEPVANKAKNASPEAYVIISLILAVASLISILIPSGAPASLLLVALAVILFIVSLFKVNTASKKGLVTVLLIANAIILILYGYYIYRYREASDDSVRKIRESLQNQQKIIEDSNNSTRL